MNWNSTEEEESLFCSKQSHAFHVQLFVSIFCLYFHYLKIVQLLSKKIFFWHWSPRVCWMRKNQPPKTPTNWALEMQTEDEISLTQSFQNFKLLACLIVKQKKNPKNPSNCSIQKLWSCTAQSKSKWRIGWLKTAHEVLNRTT